MNAVKSSSRTKKEKIPDYLIYEVMDGKPYYRKGYKDVLNKTKTLEEIMGSSALQFIILQHLIRLIARFDIDEKYYIGNNEAGLHMSKKNNIANDIAIFSKTVLTPDKITDHYANVPPRIVIEVDTKAEAENLNSLINLKTQKMLDFGVERVIWIFTESRKVMVAVADEDWLIKDWNKDVEIMDGHFFNIAAYLAKEGIQLEEQA